MDLSALIRLRFLQVFRILKEIGPLLLLLLLFVSIAFIGQLLGILWTIDLKSGLFLGTLIIGLAHFTRKDLNFLKVCVSNFTQLRKILLAEYFLLLLLPIILSLIGQNFIGALGLSLASLISLIIPLQLGTLYSSGWNSPLSWIPLHLFELKSLLRRRLPIMFLFYLLGYFSFLHIAFFIVSIAVTGLFLSSAFEWIEPPGLIKWRKNFLLKKISQNLGFIFILYSPVFLLCLIFHPSQYYFILFGILFITLIITFSVAFKYAQYKPHFVRTPQSIIHALFFLFLIIPGFQLVSLFLCVRYFLKAKNTMTFFWGNKY